MEEGSSGAFTVDILYKLGDAIIYFNITIVTKLLK